jgi:hypothetical protein
LIDDIFFLVYTKESNMTIQKSKGKRGGKRPGAGRPPTLNDPVRFLMTFERAEIDALEAIAKERDQSIASLVRSAVTAYLRRRRR